MRYKISIPVIFIAIVFLITISSGCINQPANNTITELTWVVKGEKPNDHNFVIEKLNLYLKDKISVKLNLAYINEDSYSLEVDKIFNGSNYADIVWVSSSYLDYSNYLFGGKILDISEYVDQSPIKNVISSQMWNSVTYGKSKYGIPTYKNSVTQPYFIFNEEYVKKYNINYSSLKSLYSFDSVLKNIKQSEPHIYPFNLDKNGYMGLFDEFELIFENLPIGIYLDEKENIKVYDLYETTEVIDKLEVLNTWYNQGYINKDASYIDRYNSEVIISADNGDSIKNEDIEKKYNYNIIKTSRTENYYTNNTTQNSINVIPEKSNNKDASFKLLELINTDSYVRNLLAFGIEDQNYRFSNDTQIVKLNDNYNPPVYTQGTFFNLYTLSDELSIKWEQVKKNNQNSKMSPILGFIPNTTDINEKILECASIYSKWKPHINTGAQKYSDAIPKMIKELDKSGYRDIINVVQQQIDVFNKK